MLASVKPNALSSKTILMKAFRNSSDLLVFSLVVSGFVYVASQRLGSAPLPDDGDESMTLQVPYEIINRGQYGWPMYRYQAVT